MSSLLDHPLLSARYFFPRRGPLDGAFWVEAADGASRLACYRSAPHADPQSLTLLHFHGNAEIVADYVPHVVPLLNALGVNVVLAEYRGFGGSTGRPVLGGMLDDVERVFAATGVPASRTIAFGRSLGSFFAAELVARHPDTAGLVLESGIADPMEPGVARVSAAELGVSDEALLEAVRTRVDQRAKLAGYRQPLLVLHTAADMLIPVSHGERLYAWGGAPASEKELVVFEHGDHGTIFPANRDIYLARLSAFIERVRAARGPHATAGASGR